MPEKIRQLAEPLGRSDDFTGIDICQNEDTAFKLLEYSNRLEARNELIVIRSQRLQEIKRLKAITTSQHIEWMGFDCIAIGDWSLIEAGIFRSPDYYRSWRSKINKYGLFDDAAYIPTYAAAYEEAVAKGISEPLAKESNIFFKIAVEVGKIKGV